MSLTVFVLVLLAAMMHAAWSFIARSVMGNMAVMYLAICTGACAILPIAIGRMVLAGSLPPLDGLGFMLVSGCLHACYIISVAKGYEHGEISLVYPISRGTGVAGTALVGGLLLGESITTGGALGVAAIAAGVLMLGLAGRGLRSRLLPASIALLGGCIITTFSLWDSRGVRLAGDPLVYMLAPSLGNALLFTPYVLLRHRRRIAPAWRFFKPHILLMGPGGMATYLIILFAFGATGEAGYVVAIRETSVVFGSLLGFAYLGERVGPVKAAAVIAIVAGAVLVKLAG